MSAADRGHTGRHARLPQTEAELLLLRARATAGRGFAWQSLHLYDDAVQACSSPLSRRALAEERLQHCVNAFGPTSSEALDAASSLARLDPDGFGAARHHYLRGLAASQRARSAADEAATVTAGAESGCVDARTEALAAALKEGDAAVAELREAVRREPNNPDNHGTLGGALSRMADWSAELGSDDAETLRGRAVAAYQAGAGAHPDPYCLLSFLVERSIGDGGELLREGERERLDSAMRLRRNQLRDGVDRPWPAFDLALGRWMSGAGRSDRATQLVADLGTAVREAREAAHSPEDRWMVRSALRVYERLDAANGRQATPARLHGLPLAIGFLSNQLDEERWYATRLPPITHPDDVLRAQLDSLWSRIRLEDEELASDVQAVHSLIDTRWSAEDERAFEQWIADNREQWESADKKWARAFWGLMQPLLAEAKPRAVAAVLSIIQGR